MSTDIQPKGDSSSKRGDLIEPRMQRIQEYQIAALANADPLRANLGVEAGNLMRMGVRLGEAIETSLAKSTDVLQEAKRVSAAMETYLKLTRQWDRLLHLDDRIADGERHDRRQRS